MGLRAAIAPQRRDQIAREAGRVEPNQRFGAVGQIAEDDGHRLLIFVLHAISDDPGRSVLGRQIRLRPPVQAFIKPIFDRRRTASCHNC